MKRLYIALFLLTITMCGWAQSMKQVVYLKNGSVIRCEILEQTPGQSIKIRTTDGSIFVYNMEDVEKISLEERKYSDYKPAGQGREGLELALQSGYAFALSKNAGGELPIEVMIGKQVNENLFFGLSSGTTFSGKEFSSSIPLTANAKFMLPSSKSPLVPYVSAGIGYKLSLKKSEPDAITLNIMPGVAIPLNGGSDFLLSFGYMHQFYKKGGSGALALKTGIQFHKNPNKSLLPPKPKKPKKPTRENGAFYNIEGGIAGGWVKDMAEYDLDDGLALAPIATLVFGYNLSSAFSVGAGVSYTKLTSDVTERQEIMMNYENIQGFQLKKDCISPFVRASYRASKKCFSPLVSCDFGIDMNQGSEDIKEKNGFVYEGSEQINKQLFVRPAIGFSVRTSANSYWEVKAFYMKMQKATSKYYDSSDSRWISIKPVSTDSYGFTLSFKRNLKLFSK